MKFPIHVYQSPGSYVRKGFRFKLASAADRATLDALLAAGWHMTLDEAVKAAGDDAKLHRPRSDWRTRKARDAKLKAQRLKERQETMAAQAARKSGVKVKKPEPVPEPVEESIIDDAPPTRQELEHQATLLGLKFDGRTSDKRLLERIDEAMKGA